MARKKTGRNNPKAASGELNREVYVWEDVNQIRRSGDFIGWFLIPVQKKCN
jgi:hypothetical protein